MSLDLTFSTAYPLLNMHNKSTREAYDYKNRPNRIFSEIEQHFKITSVEKVYNPQLYGMYLLCKEELETSNKFAVKEKYLYHATSSTNAINISKNNIDWRLTNRGKYGYGACFSTSPKYANKYSYSKGAFIIFKVLTKRKEFVNFSCGLKVPTSTNMDTVVSYNSFVYVKFDDYYFYPEFIVFYS